MDSINDLTFYTRMNNKKIEALINSTRIYYSIINMVQDHLYTVNEDIHYRRILDNYKTAWLSDTLIRGVLNNQIQTAYLIMLRKRVIALQQLGQSRMSPDLITPTILNNTIQRLSSQLRIHYPDLHITNENIRDLYNNADVTGIFYGNRIYVQVPIPVNTYEQIFDVYKLESFLNPIDNDVGKATILSGYNRYIAVNKHDNLYVPLDTDFIRNCKGHSMKRCEELVTQYEFDNVKTCSSSIYIGNIKDINKLCTIGLVNISENIQIKFHELRNNSVLVINPRKQPVYQRCNNEAIKSYITNEELATIRIKCWCWLHVENVARTPVMANHNCINVSTTVNVITHHNILYAANAMNISLSKMKSIFNSTIIENIPTLKIPEYSEIFRVPSNAYGNVYDLKMITKQQNTYQSLLWDTVMQNEVATRNIPLFRITSYVISSIIFIIIILVGFLFCKTKGIIRLLSIGKLIQSSSALPIRPPTSFFITSQTALITWDIMSMAILLLALVYWIIKHVKLIRRCMKYLAFPCKEFHMEKINDNLQVFLYFSSLQAYCYIKVDELYASPHQVSVMQSETDINLTLHDGCFGSYLTIIQTNLCLKVEDKNKWLVNNTIHIPLYAKNTLRAILSSEFKVQILIGTNCIYQAYNINLKTEETDKDKTP